jgi:cellulose synthase/poly-beta-1,6-N-acetylglucosamine synthase-like glycosyltransferase
MIDTGIMHKLIPWICAASALAIFYVLLGYPILLALLARWFPKPVRRDAEYRETVTVIIAVRNGARWLARKIESVLAQDYPQELRDIIIVSDGSSDSTDQIAESFANRKVSLLRVPQGGKPAALNAAAPHATGTLLFLTDVRQVLKPDCLSRLVAAMADPEVGVVSGDLRIAQATNEEQANTGLYWRYENGIRTNLARLDSMLGATGPVNLIRRALYVPIPPDSLLDDMYLPMSIHLKGYRLVLDTEAVAIDEPTDLATEFRRKMRTQAGILQLLATFPGLFSSRNRMRFHFVSLKLGRLLLPYLLGALLLSSLALPAPWRWWMAGPQLAFWLLALADPLFRPGSLLKKVSALPRAFAVLVSSAVFGLKILFVPPRKLWVEARK